MKAVSFAAQNVLVRSLAISARRTFEQAVCWWLDCSFFYEPPFHRFKSRMLRRLLGAQLAPDCFVMNKVRAANWRNVKMETGALLADRVYLRSHAPITLGAWSMVGPEAMIISGGHTTTDMAVTTFPVVIGRGVFIGARALVLEGITIGDHAMIGAGTTVTRDVPPLAIVAGNPGKIIGYRDQPDRIWSLTGTVFFPPDPRVEEMAADPHEEKMASASAATCA